MKKKYGFSLAEALITLLIVSLVTLASIPVITKKKRFTTTNGLWMCTRNSDGIYVYYDQNDPQGEKDNPDTWRTAGTEECKFTPPPGATQYSITVIGGGGGGGDGRNEKKQLRTATGGNATSFQPAKDGLYTVEVVGGGGGGGGPANSDCSWGPDNVSRPAAAAGGSGASFFGLIWLRKDTSYTMTAGVGGDVGRGEHHGGCNRSSLDNPNPGKSGTQSSFKYDTGGSDTTTEIIAGPGEGGNSVVDNADCAERGGDKPGAGGKVIKANYLTLNSNDTGIKKTGFSGEAGDPRDWSGKDYYDGPNDQPQGGGTTASSETHGKGGNGGTQPDSGKGFAKSATKGTNGYVSISETTKYYGLGGKAAIPSTYFIHRIEGQVFVTIADRAENTQNGGETVALIKKGNTIGRKFTSNGAAGAGNSKDIDGPQKGEDSLFSMAGGGLPAGDCSNPQLAPAGTKTEERDVPRCTKIACHILPENYSIEKNTTIIENNKDNSGMEVVPAGFGTILYNGVYLTAPVNVLNGTSPIDVPAYCKIGNNCSLNPSSKNYFDVKNYMQDGVKLYNYIKKQNYNATDNEIDIYLPKANEGDFYDESSQAGAFYEYSNAAEIYNNYRCFRDTNLYYEKTCLDSVIEKAQVQIQYGESVIPAQCKTHDGIAIEAGSDLHGGGNGTLFGAGGGGGNASETPGVTSKGGYGGYGGVIIEW